MEKSTSGSGSPAKYVPYILLAMILGMVLFVRIRLLQAPMERDEGEYAYMGQLLLKGLSPYASAYTMKLPGVSFMYALSILCFGQTITGIHMGLLVVNGICVFLVFVLARRVLDVNAAVISCATYAVLSLSQSVDGVYAHATHFVVLFSLAGFLLLLRYVSKNSLFVLFVGGICFGLAFIMKQHAVLLIGSAFLYLVRNEWKKADGGLTRLIMACFLFSTAVMIPYALVALYVFKAGAFGEFWFWTVTYAREYVSELTFEQGIHYFVITIKRIVTPQMPFWLLAGAGMAALFSKQSGKTNRFFIVSLFFFSLLSTCPGFYFREHYFVMLLPAVALMAGAAARSAEHALTSLQSGYVQQSLSSLLLVIAVAYGIYQEKGYYFVLEPQQVTRTNYGLNPFPEMVQVARYIRERTDAGDRIAVLGSEPELFFYADRRSATRHIYMYGLMEKQRYAEQMQLELIREIEMVKPKYVVMVNTPSSWGIPPFVSHTIIDWGEKYAAEQYDLVGITDIIDADTTRYIWGESARTYRPVSDTFLCVLKRKGTM